MTSRKPPSQRDPAYMAARYGRALQSMAPGTLQGRVANASPVIAASGIVQVAAVDTSETAAPSSGLTIAYIENTVQVVLGTTVVSFMQLSVTTTDVSNAIAGINLQGTASQALTLTISVVHSGTVVTTFQDAVPAGPATIGIPFILQGILAETASWTLRASTSAGTFTLPLGKSAWWIESSAISGGLTAYDPSSTITELVNSVPVTVTDVATTSLQTPRSASATDSVNSSPVTTTDSVTVAFGNTLAPVAGADDGYVSTATFNATTLLRVGNSSGDLRTLFIRWTLPVDLKGKTINSAFVDLTPDTAQLVSTLIRIDADANGAAATVTSKSNLDARTRTTARVDTSSTSAAGTVITYNVTTLMAEIAAGASSTFVSFLLLISDRGSPTDTELAFRAVEYSVTANRPQLRVSYA